jgi:hypothetical protein
MYSLKQVTGIARRIPVPGLAMISSTYLLSSRTGSVHYRDQMIIPAPPARDPVEILVLRIIIKAKL